MKTAIIIKGNPAFVDGDPDANHFYHELKQFLEEQGYQVTLDPGLPHTQPEAADVWIGHSRGTDRLRFAPTGTMTIALGIEGGINHPLDKSLHAGDVPDKYHYILTDETKQAILKKLA